MNLTLIQSITHHHHQIHCLPLIYRLLPAPTHRYDRHQEQEDEVELIGEQQQSSSTSSSSSSSARKQIPPYLQRAQYLPLGVEDFGDGGAFPEIHVVQYPLNMSKPGMKSSAVVAVNVAETGEVRFDSIVKQGSNRNRLVQSTLNDIKAAKDGGDRDLLALPGEKEEAETADKTRLALEALVNGKIKSSKPVSGGSVQKDPDEPTYIRYAPDPNAIGYVRCHVVCHVVCCSSLLMLPFLVAYSLRLVVHCLTFVLTHCACACVHIAISSHPAIRS